MWGCFFFVFFSRAYRCELSASQSLQMSVLRVCVSVCVCISGGRVATRFHLRLADGGRVAQFRGLGVHLKTQRVAVASAREGSPLRMTLVSWFLFFSSSFFLPS